MALRFTVQSFPADKDLRDNTGLPWGCTVQPFATSEDTPEVFSAAPLTLADDVARCEECYAYINAYCSLERHSWRCTLCDARNSFPANLQSRYGNRARLAECAELASSLVDLDVTVEEDVAPNAAADLFDRPVYVALVDLSSSEEFLELVKSALLAALEALTPGSLFGLATFGRKVGLYDVQGDIPVVKQVAIHSDEDPLPLPLASVLHLESFLAPVHHHKEHLAAALETLKPASEPPRKADGEEDEVTGGRGFGAALEGILAYLGGEEGHNSFVSACVFGFLSGPPDLGLGKVDVEGSTPPHVRKLYSDMAAQAVQSGIAVDLCVLTASYCDLASLKALCTESGGGLALYPNLEEATLPQDMYRQLSRPRATAAVLRLRCSPEFEVVRAYGSLFPDAQYECVQHIISCHPADTFAFDLEFNAHSKFSRSPDQAPMIQMAFQYTILIPEEGEGGEVRYVLRRRLRVRTVRLEVARTAKELFETADYETILALLTHKISLACSEEGVAEGRVLLMDWLVILTANYNNYFKLAQFEQPSTIPQLDVAFTLCLPLQALTRVVFALLRSPLLQLDDASLNPDVRVYLHCLYSTLEPSYLIRAIYPLLSSYSSPNKLAYPRHSLSRAALVTSGSPIFLLDAYSTLVVYYSPMAPKDLTFPPPHNSLLRNTINKLKQDRNITPHLVMVRGGVDNSEIFERFLLEEQDVDGTNDGMGTGFVTFLEEIANAVRTFMKFE